MHLWNSHPVDVLLGHPAGAVGLRAGANAGNPLGHLEVEGHVGDQVAHDWEGAQGVTVIGSPCSKTLRRVMQEAAGGR